MFARIGWLALVALVAAALWTGLGWVLGLPGSPRLVLFGAVFVLSFVVMLFMGGAKTEAV